MTLDNADTKNVGLFRRKVKDISDWGNITEIVDTNGNVKTVLEVLDSNPDYEIYTDVNGNIVHITLPESRNAGTVTTGVNPNTVPWQLPTLLTLDANGFNYTDIWGNNTRKRAFLSEAPLELSNDLFYLVAPYTGLEDYVTTKGMLYLGKGVSALARTSRNFKDVWWLAKNMNKQGRRGLRNPYIRGRFLKYIKDPSLVRQFSQKYNRNGEPVNISLNQIRELNPQLLALENEYRITPKGDFYFNDESTLQNIKDGLELGRNASDQYLQDLLTIKDNKVLYNIAKESPLYLQQIANDYRNGNIINLEDYVKDLMKQSNTFLRRMNLPNNISKEDLINAFSVIQGKTFEGKTECII